MPYIDLKVEPLFRRPELLQHGQIPRPMAQVAPRNIMGQEWWDVKRREAYAANNFCCFACGANEMLDAHEAYDIDYAKGLMTFVEIVALCQTCHAFIHAGLTKLKQTPAEFKRVTLHGHRILKKNKLRAHWTLRTVLTLTDLWAWPVIENIGPTPSSYQSKWYMWRMVFDGNKYPPKFANSTAADAFFESKGN